ncbi:MAG: (Fe-S)-binding protein [Thermodesulfobacteriota bacterium]
MALEQYEEDLMRCNRCSYCKHVPHDAMTDARFTGICPSIEKYLFHSRSASGRLITALSLMKGRIELDDAARDRIFQCQMCGGCDVSCKVERDLEPREILQELRSWCAERGAVPQELLGRRENLKREGNTLGEPRGRRGDWAEGLAARMLGKEKAEVLFHAGCQYALDPALRPTARNALGLLLDAGADVGILGKAEMCCGGQVYETGFRDEAAACARRQVGMWKNAGVRTVVTPCASCFQAFKVLYDKIGVETGVEVLHITEFILRLIREGRLRPGREVPLKAAWHDPCHLGRLAEPWVHWKGEKKKVFGQLVVHDPPKSKRFGVRGVYDTPREVLRAIPGLNLIEMHRVREYSWCCGAGGGAEDAFPELAESAAAQRIEEALSVGAEALVTSCPRCVRRFRDSIAQTGVPLEVFDLVDVVRRAV